MATSSRSDNVLFFIPDIGGFTRFVTETEVHHSQHIVKELLELLVDANQLGLEVSEFEGDAVLFFRTGALPTLAELLAQAKKMFVAFHSHLKQLDVLRVCQCGACVGLSRISLKFVVHSGPASAMEVKGHAKFIGRSIIVAHRLLKNSVPEAEYLLVTEDTLNQLGEGAAAVSPFERGAHRYDEIGEVAYRHHPLAAYRAEANVEAPENFGLAHPCRVLALSQHIHAPPSEVYQRLIDLPARMNWVEGIQRVEFRDRLPNHIGKRHRYVVAGADPEVVTSDVRAISPTVELWETEVHRTSALRYLVAPEPIDATTLTMELHLPDTVLRRMKFRLFERQKLEPFFTRSLENLAHLIEGSRAAP